jgi:hypothetical protein
MKTTAAALLALAALLLASGGTPGRGQEDEKKDDKKGEEKVRPLKLGQKYEGEHKGKREYVSLYLDKRLSPTFSHEDVYKVTRPIELEAGDPVSLSVTVTGSGRRVALALQDPAGDFIAVTPTKEFGVKTAKLSVEEVNATGRYTVYVISDRIGNFTLYARKPQQQSRDDDKELEKKIAAAEKELEAMKKELEARKKKDKK